MCTLWRWVFLFGLASGYLCAQPPDSVQIQLDSLSQVQQAKLNARIDSLLASNQRPDTLLPWYAYLPGGQGFPVRVQDERLEFHLPLPLRPDIDLVFPKFVYAGPTPPYDPQVAWQRSLIIPGWGQYYNRAAWKIPIIYGGYGAVGFLFLTTQNQYKNFQRAYRVRIQLEDPNVAVSEADSLFLFTNSSFIRGAPNTLRTQRDLARRQRDYLALGVIGYHLIWVVEAYIQAHLRGLDVSDDLSLRFEPVLEPGRYGLGVRMRF